MPETPGRYFLFGALTIFAIVICAGCLATTVGDAGYTNGSVIATISHTGQPADVQIQVTIYRIENLVQEQYRIVSAPARLLPGENHVEVPVELDRGDYKLFIYVLSNGDRRTAVIRDITV